MGISLFIIKYLLVASGFGSATIVPLMYSQGNLLSSPRGGQLISSESSTEQLFQNNLISQTPETEEIDINFEGEEKLLSKQLKSNTLRNRENTVTQVYKGELKVKHEIGSDYQGLVSYEQFKEIYGTKGFKEEGAIGIKGAENMTILDAWEKFFKKRELGSSFFLGNGEKDSLPFWNYDFPYIAVQLPKEFSLYKNQFLNATDEGWIKVESNLELRDFKDGIKTFSDSKEGSDYTKVTFSRGMLSSEDTELYIVTNPEKLLRIWVGDWNNLISKKAQKDNFALFENIHYDQTEEHPEVSVLKRWWKGKSYRMWIFHKELKPESVEMNKREFEISNKDSKLKLNLKWSKNFLLNLLVWYAYTYKLGNESLSYSETNHEGGWDLKSIYSDNNNRNNDDLSNWIKDWYSGVGRDNWVYWWNLSILKGRRFNRTERINWVGEVMDNLSDSWGKVKR